MRNEGKKRYPKYKDSGIPWIGEIPEHWEVKKLKYEFKFITGFTPPSGKNEYYENGIHIWVNISDMNKKYIDNSEKKITDKAIEDFNPQIVPKGSLLYSFKLTVGKTAFVLKDCYTNEAIFSVLPSGDCNLDFFYYALPDQVIKNSNENIYGAKILNQELIKNAYLIIPPQNEQSLMANYLDRKTAEIDTLIAKKERLLELYEEEKKAIINRAVTKGINPDVKMKESGIPWLGEIPEHWEVKKLKYVAKSLNHLRVPLSASERGIMMNKVYDYYGASGIIDKVEDYLFDEPLILIGEDGANLLTRTKRLVFIARGKYWVNNHAHILKIIYGLLEYYCELLELYDFKIWVSGSAQPKLTSENLMNMDVIVPPHSEQQEIVSYIEEQISLIDSKIEKTKKMIELLKEYKTSLISEVVTGKRRVV